MSGSTPFATNAVVSRRFPLPLAVPRPTTFQEVQEDDYDSFQEIVDDLGKFSLHTEL